MTEIQNIRNVLYKQQFINELEHIESTNLDNSSDRKEHLLSIINNIDTEPVKKKGLKDMFENIDKQLYNKPWHHLKPFHRMVKIKEYLNVTIDDNNIKSKLEKEINNLIFSNKLNTKKYVVYDHNLEKIVSFPALDTDNYTIKHI